MRENVLVMIWEPKDFLLKLTLDIMLRKNVDEKNVQEVYPNLIGTLKYIITQHRAGFTEMRKVLIVEGIHGLLSEMATSTDDRQIITRSSNINYHFRFQYTNKEIPIEIEDAMVFLLLKFRIDCKLTNR